MGFVGVNLMGCYRCRKEFKPPARLRNKGRESDRTEWDRHWEVIEEQGLISKLKPDQLRFVLEVAQGMADRIPNFPCYSPFDPNEGHPDPERNYLGLYLRHYVKIGPLLQLRKSFSNSPNKQLPDEKHLAEKVLASNNPLFHPNENTRMKWAEALRKTLGEIREPYKRKKILPESEQLIRLVVMLELQKGADYKNILRKLENEDQDLDRMKYSPMFQRYKNRYGIETWTDIIENKNASAAFQVWLSRRRTELRRRT